MSKYARVAQEGKAEEDLWGGMKREKILLKEQNTPQGYAVSRKWICCNTRWERCSWGAFLNQILHTLTGSGNDPARAAHGDGRGQNLGDGCSKHSHHRAGKCSRQKALEGAAKKRYQTLRKLTQMEHKMPLRETSEVQMKPCPAKTCYTKLQMDDRNMSRRMQLPSAKSCRTCFPRHFSSAVSTNCRA